MSESPIKFDCYLEPRPITAQWWIDLLHALWQRGLRCTQTPQAALTWEAELEASDHLIVGPRGRVIVETLQEGVAQLADLGGAGLALWDNGVEFGLDLYPTDLPTNVPGRSSDALPLPPLMRLSLSLAGDRIPPPGSRPANYLDPYEIDLAPWTLLPGYLQKHLGLLHWSSVLCERLDPVYGIGYDPDDVRDDLIGFHVEIQQALSERRLPETRANLSGGFIQYLSPSFATTERITSLLAMPGWSMRRLANGGLFVLSAGVPFQYERGAANRHVRLGNQARLTGSLDDIEREESLLEMLKHYRRALTIYSASGDTAGVEAMHTLLPNKAFVSHPADTGK